MDVNAFKSYYRTINYKEQVSLFFTINNYKVPLFMIYKYNTRLL